MTRRRRQIRTAPRRRDAVVLMLIALVIASSAAVAQVWTHLAAIEFGYKIARATQQRAKLLEKNRRLRVELALLKDPARVARIAEKQLGLRAPEPEQIRRLRRPRPRRRALRDRRAPRIELRTAGLAGGAAR